MFSIVLSIILLIRLRCGKQVPIFDYINQRYGEDARASVRQYENISKKHAKTILDLDFLIKCKTYNIFPKFLQFKLYKRSLQSSHFYRSWQSKLLHNEIHVKKKSLIDLKNKLSVCIKDIKHVVSGLDFIIIDRNIRSSICKFRTDTLKTHEKKLLKLGIQNDLKPCEPDSVVFNYSSLKLSNRVKTLLAFGLSFCLPVYRINQYLLLTNIFYHLNLSFLV